MSAPSSAALMPLQFDSRSPYSSPSSSIITVIIIVASAVTASATIYLLLRFLSNRLFHGRSFSAAADDVVSQTGGASSHRACCHVASRGLLDSLPLFSFRSVTGNIVAGGYCAVCLSKFEPDDRLRLLPLCCHVFHADCIDAWIASNQTCPLCRSTVLPCGSDALDKILFLNNSVAVSGGSFRIEIGSISRRGDAGGGARRCYSLGSFEFIVDENECEVPVDCTTHRRGVSDEVKLEIPTAEGLAAEVSGGRNWLREYVDKISCRATSFRSSGRMFGGS